MPSVLAFFCYHNRKCKTIACAQSLLGQTGLGSAFSVQIMALDDGSTDGTTEALQALVPQAEICHADGSWFWARSMAYLYALACERVCDYLLLLNDDVILDQRAILDALDDLAQLPTGSVLVGKTIDPGSGHWTYGGQRYRHPALPLWFVGGDPGEGLQRVHTLNANFVLIPRDIARQVPMCGAYSHAFADIDLGLRLTRAGYTLFQSSHSVGTCAWNPQRGTWLDPELPFRTRLRLLNTRKGMPWRDRLRYTWRNGGLAWMWFFVNPYLKFFWGALKSSRISPPGESRKP